MTAENDLMLRAKTAVKAIDRNKRVYAAEHKKYDHSAARMIWRHKLHIQELITKGMLCLNDNTDTGPTINKWRSNSLKHHLVTRHILLQCLEVRGRVTVAGVTQSLRKEVEISTVKKCMRDGVELKLLHRNSDGYLPTDLLINEIQDRVTQKILNKDVIAFCRFVTMFTDARKFAFEALKNDRGYDGAIQKTLLEELMEGMFFDVADRDI